MGCVIKRLLTVKKSQNSSQSHHFHKLKKNHNFQVTLVTLKCLLSHLLDLSLFSDANNWFSFCC